LARARLGYKHTHKNLKNCNYYYDFNIISFERVGGEYGFDFDPKLAKIRKGTD
jgi:hypothetical protein